MRSLRECLDRTICSCADCSVYCRTMPGMLAPGDVELIMEARRCVGDQRDWMELFAASPGAIVMTEDHSVFRIPTIVPATTDSGCIFLEVNGLCAVHQVSPFGCGWFDSHQSDGEANYRSSECLHEICRSEQYQRQWQQLVDAGRTTTGPEHRRLLSGHGDMNVNR